MLKATSILVLFSLLALGGWYYLAHPKAWNSVALAPKAQSRESTTTLPQEPLSSASAKLTSNSEPTVLDLQNAGQRENIIETTCNLPATSTVKKAATSEIYRWADEHGQTHFADQSHAAGMATGYKPQSPARMDYFTMAIEFKGRTPVLVFRNQLPRQVTGIYQILTEFLGAQRLRKVNLNIVIHPNALSYAQYATTLLAGRNMSNYDGFYSLAMNQAVTYVFPNPEHTLAVAKHESTHVIMAAVLGLPPLWLNEGLAEYFEMLTINGLYKEILPQEPWLTLARETIQSDYPKNLNALLQLDSENWHSQYETRHYAISWALVYFLMSSQEGKASMASLLRNLADHYCQPIDSESILDSSYVGGINQLQHDFYSWLNDSDAKRTHLY